MYHADRVYGTMLPGGGILIVILNTVMDEKSRSDVDFLKNVYGLKYVFCMGDGSSLLIGCSHYFHPTQK